MRYPYSLVIRAADSGHRQYYIVRAEESAIDHHTDDNLDLFFRRLTDLLNDSNPEIAELQDRIIQLRLTNKGLMNLIRLILRKFSWTARRLTEKAAREYAIAVAVKLRQSADEIEKEVLERGSNSGQDGPAEGDSDVDGVHEQEPEFPDAG